MGEHTHESVVPGLTQQQLDVLTLVIDRAAVAAAKSALSEQAKTVCAVHMEQVAGHHVTLYGEDGRGGLCQAVERVTSTVQASRKLAWVAIGAAPAGLLSVILFLVGKGG